MDERSGDVISSFIVERVSDTPEITDMVVAGFTYSGNLVMKRQTAVKYNAKVAC